jgi:protein phosphatase 2C family protein 2/3
MEDRYLIHLFNDIAVFGVFDGHSGTAAADVVCSRLIPALRGQFKKKFESGIRFSFTNSNPQPPDAIEEETMAAMQDCLHEAVKEVEQEAIVHLSAHLDYSGCTLCVCLCTRSTLLVANLGDSRVVMSRKGGKMQQVTKKDHVAKDDKERQRIEESGGFVNAEGYLGGKVQVSRAIGDIDSDTGNKIVGLSSDPDLSKFPLDIESDEFIIMACDGLWEVFSLQGAVNFVREALKRTKGDLSKATDELVKKAIELKTTDNVTVIIAYLPKVENIWMKDISSRTPTPDDDERPRLFKKKPNVSV